MSAPKPPARSTRVGQSWFALLFVAGALLGGCKGKGTPQRPFEVCGQNKPCPGQRACILSPGVPAGACVQPCAADRDCPDGHRCTGRYRPLQPASPPTPNSPPAMRPDRAQAYCQAATVPLGGDCTGLRDGCQAGLECQLGRLCVRSCEGDADCRQEERCVAQRDQRVFGTEAPALYSICVLASAGEGATCGADRRPLCGRGHACHRTRCVKQCAKDEDCGAQRICDGEGSAPARDGDGHEPFRYCRRAAAGGEACGQTPERDLACARDHRCYRGKCRRSCETDADCAAGEGRPGRCRPKRRRGETWRLCY